MSKGRGLKRKDAPPGGWARRHTDRPTRAHHKEILASSGWETALTQFAQATGLAVTLFDAGARLQCGPITPTPLTRRLAEAGGWEQPAGHCYQTETSAALACAAENAVIHRQGLNTLALIAVPVRLDDLVIGAIIAGWVFDHFPDPVSTDRLAKTLNLPFTELWQTVRQQPPVSHEKLNTYAELLQTLADSFLRERAEALKQQERSHELLVLNVTGQRLAAASTVAEIGAAVVEAATILARAKRARLLIAGADGEWHTVAAHGLTDASQTHKAGGREVTNSLRVPVEASDGQLIAHIELEAGDGAHLTDARAHLSGLAGQAAVALQKSQLIADLERERASLDRANRTKDQFLSVLSHELRTPLTPILGWATMLREKLQPPVDETLETGLAAIERNARQELHLVDEMLDLSRILNDKIHLEPEAIAPKDALVAAFALARSLAEQRGQRLEMEVSQNLPLIYADTQRLQQILSNLVTNAAKFTPDGGSIKLAARRGEDGMVEFVVADTGKGIHPEFLPHIFERFRQADSTTTRLHGGLGIGLSIVRGLVDMHGGRVRVESEGEGRGATFIVSLPAAEVPLREASEPPQTARAGTTQCESPRGMTVLLVDDSPDTLIVIKMMIEDAGYTVVTAETATLALEIARRDPPACIVTDIGMPEADGFKLLRELRADERLSAVPVVALTGYATQLDREAMLSAGFADHLPKPVEQQSLVNALDRVVTGRA